MSGLARSAEGEEFVGDCRSMGVGWAELAERVWEDMDVSGEKEGGAILFFGNERFCISGCRRTHDAVLQAIVECEQETFW